MKCAGTFSGSDRYDNDCRKAFRQTDPSGKDREDSQATSASARIQLPRNIPEKTPYSIRNGTAKRQRDLKDPEKISRVRIQAGSYPRKAGQNLQYV